MGSPMITRLISFKRSLLETLAVCHYVYIWILMPLWSTWFPIYLLFFTKYWWLMCIYFAWFLYDRNTPRRGGRRWEFYRNASIWKYFASYFPMKLVKTAELPPDRNYIIGLHPHGVLSMSNFTHMCTEGTSFSKHYPNLISNILTLNGQFYFPIRREIGLSVGGVECSHESLRYLLEHPGKGRAIGIVIGGAQEVLDAHANTFNTNILHRKGFVQFALKYGADLVPSYSFGENDLYGQMDNPIGSKLRSVQDLIKKKCGFCPPVFFGQSILLNIGIGMLPRRTPITTVIGSPIRIEKVDGEPSSEQIAKVHTKYCEELYKLFEAYKHLHNIDKDASYLICVIQPNRNENLCRC
ncbi:hypothetical protein AB6A40_000098 [Gnathostoma spinigerum]|uniref:Acyltransferase n=1 Tax=Gnathostoma spinigerum TaxID=75299 RepID=A0ABD6E5M8_9BILA